MIILLTGTSGTGKSTLASLLADRLRFTTVISTDHIREMLRGQCKGHVQGQSPHTDMHAVTDCTDDRNAFSSQQPALFHSTYQAYVTINDPPAPKAPYSFPQKVSKRISCTMSTYFTRTLHFTCSTYSGT